MSGRHGHLVISWLHDGGKRFLRPKQPYAYQQLLFHTCATNILYRYDDAKDYWHYVQAILDNFFTSAERAEMCRELIDAPIFKGREDFRPFLIEAKAEIRAQEVMATVDIVAERKATLRSVG